MAGDILDGAIDLHCHTHPSLMARGSDYVTEAEEADAAGMRAVVIKDHLVSSAVTMAILKTREAELFAKPRKVQLIGSVVLNSHAGGLNPYVVEVALEYGAMVVWLPTISARGHVEYAAARPRPQSGPFARLNNMRPLEPLDVADADGKPAPEVLEIFELVKKYDAVLATGHVDPRQVLAILPHARAMGLEKIVVTHPTMPFVDASADEMAEMVRQGAYLEHEVGFWEPSREGGWPLESLTGLIQTYGAGSTVLSTDLGNAGSRNPTEGMRLVAEALVEHGVSDPDLDRLIRTTPAALLGI